MFRSWRDSLAARLEVIWEIATMVFSLSGVTVASIFGNFVLAVLLAAVALGIFLRIKRRGRKAGRSAP